MTPDLSSELRESGLGAGSSYCIIGADLAHNIMTKEDNSGSMYDSENLLVFMSTFFGEIGPAITLSRLTKEVNPRVKVILRSISSSGNTDPVFDRYIKKLAILSSY